MYWVMEKFFISTGLKTIRWVVYVIDGDTTITALLSQGGIKGGLRQSYVESLFSGKLVLKFLQSFVRLYCIYNSEKLNQQHY